MRVSPTNEWIPRIFEWVTTERMTHADCSERLLSFGIKGNGYRCELLRCANEQYKFGWPVRRLATIQAEIESAQARIKELHGQGVSRAEAKRIISTEYTRSVRTVDEWLLVAYEPFEGRRADHAPTPGAASPPDAVALAASIEAELRADGHADAAACACEYDSDLEVWRWGAAVVYGNPARILMAHDLDDFRRQYRKEAAYAIAS